MTYDEDCFGLAVRARGPDYLMCLAAEKAVRQHKRSVDDDCHAILFASLRFGGHGRGVVGRLDYHLVLEEDHKNP